MKNLRRLARLALCFCALLLFLPGRAEAAGGLFGNELAWYLDDEGMLTISGFGPMPDYADETQVPWYSYIDSIATAVIGDGVTRIGQNAFCACANLTSVSIPGGLTAIGASAFSGCVGLTALSLPDSVTDIGEYAFSGCTGLTSVNIPGGVTAIANGVFFGCAALSSVMLPAGITAIGDSAFFDCEQLTSIGIPGSVTAIGSGAFQGCAGLTGIALPNGLTSVADYLLEDCTALKTVTLPGSITAIGDSAFQGCTALKALSLPGSLTTIGDGAFSGCDHLTSITIPDSVTTIGDGAFEACARLTGFQIPGSVTSLGSFVFQGCKRLVSVTLPDGLTAITDYLFAYCPALTSISLPDSVTAIGDSAFNGCTALADIALPDGLETIGSWAFTGCTALAAVALPGSVTSIGIYVFQGCTGLTELSVDGNNAAYSSLDGVLYSRDGKVLLRFPCGRGGFFAIPEGVETIGSYAFQGCDRLTGIAIPDGVANIGDGAFEDCVGLTVVTLPDNVYTLGTDAFYGCDHLNVVRLPASINSIGPGAFSYCDSLSAVYYGGSEEMWPAIAINSANECLTSAARYCPQSAEACGGRLNCALYSDGTLYIYGTGPMVEYESSEQCPWFHYADSIQAVRIGDGVTRLSSYAFCAFAELTGVIIPGSVTAIGDGAFGDCVRLTGVTLPASLAFLGDGVFSCCSSLAQISVDADNLNFASVDGILFDKSGTALLQFPGGRSGSYTIPDGVTFIGQEAFSFCRGLTEITVPLSVEIIGPGAFYGCDCLTGVHYGGSCDRWASISGDAGLPNVALFCTHTYGAPNWRWSEDHTAAGAVFACVRGDDMQTVAATVDAVTTEAATCTEEGAAEYSATVTFAGEAFSDRQAAILPALGHAWSEWENVTEPSCTEEGSEQRACQRCNEAETRALAALGHDYVATVTEPTCTEGGCTTHTCSRCSDSFVDACTDALGHEPGEPVRENYTGPTYEAEGSYDEVVCCMRCSEELSRTHVTIPALTPEKPKITRQPVDYTGPVGSTASFTVEATGGVEPLTYQWYVKKLSASRFSKSSITGPVYEVELTSARNGNQLYCVVTDAQGNQAQTDTVTMTVASPITITTQPDNFSGPIGSSASFTVEARGNGLTYQWYVKKIAASRFSKSSITGPVYEVELTLARNGNQLYCVVTDAYGNSIQTDTVTMTVASPITIATQPENFSGPIGSTASFTVQAQGEGLTYQWYVKKLSASRFSKSSITGPVYEVELTEARNGNRLYCVVTDALGNSVTSDTVSMTISDPLTIISQPADYLGPEGSTASFTVEATGGVEPLTYQWYVKKLSASRFSKSSITGPVYEVELTEARNGNRLYCVVTDALGSSVTSDTVTITMG